MNCLVTGATGFIGYNLVESLLNRGYQVTCLVRDTSDVRWLNSLGNISYIYGDITHRERWENDVSGFDWIFHMAGLTTAVNREEYFRVNHLGTRHLLEAVSSHNPDLRRFLLVSSLEAAGPTTVDHPLTEDIPPRPISYYGESKRAAELAVHDHSDNFPVTILRPPIVYGPLDRAVFPFFRLVNAGWKVHLTGDDLYLSLVYVRDLAEALVSLADTESAAGDTYYVSDRSQYTIDQIQAIMAQVFEVSPRTIPVPRSLLYTAAGISELYIKLFRKRSFLNLQKIKVVNQPAWICNSEKLVRDTGFQPEYSFADGVRETAEWYAVHGWL